ncbi:MAG: hypothetical protein ACM358_05435 [Gemmatimonadota bacterium]
MAVTPDVARVGIEKSLAQLVADLRSAAGDNVLGVALYGGLAKGRFTPGISDVNVLVVLRTTALADLERLAPVLTGARRSSRVSAFIATPDDLRDAARLFPVKMRDIQLAHHVLYGEVPLAQLQIDRLALRQRALQELGNMRFRLRQRAVERGADPRVLWGGVMLNLPKLAVTLETMLRARPGAPPPPPPPADRASVLREAGQALGVAPQKLEPFLHLHRHETAPPDATVRELFDRYVELVAEFAQRLAASEP